MTRINVGVLPQELSDRHLIAEHREIKRIPNAIRNGRARVEGIPDRFTLGKGHVKFFYNKLLYLHRRYLQLHDECRRRGFNVTNFRDAFDELPEDLYNDYEPKERDRIIILARIAERNKSI